MKVLVLVLVSLFIANTLAGKTKSKGGVQGHRRGLFRNIDGANWMRNNMHFLGGRQLKQVCIPGSHNAAMNQLSGGTAFAHKCNILTQSLPIRSQLELGVRYLDIRPVISGGHFTTGHYSKIPSGSWQGGNGQSMESIVQEISDFVRSHAELVIVVLSHSFNTDVGNKNYRSFNGGEWERLFALLDRTANLFVAHPNVYLPSLTLGQFTNGGRAGAVVYVVHDADLGARHGRGFFYPGNLQVYDKYSNTDKFSSMSADQLGKMREVSPQRYFLLSWTLTQGGKDAAMCPMKMGKDIKKIAQGANSNLDVILSQVSPAAYPNIIYLDNIVDTRVTEICMAVNTRL